MWEQSVSILNPVEALKKEQEPTTKLPTACGGMIMVCPECNGSGKTIYCVEIDRDENTVTVEQRKGICRTCNGSGKKAQTNGDQVRAMSDEELYDLFREIYNAGEADVAAWEWGRQECSFIWDEEWLKQPAEVNDE